MKYLVILATLFSASVVTAGGSGGTMGRPSQLELQLRAAEGSSGGTMGRSTADLLSSLRDLNKLDILLQNKILLEDEEAMVRDELSSTKMRLKSLLESLEQSGVDTQSIEGIAP